MITIGKISKKTLQFFCGRSKTASEKTCFEKRASRVVRLLISYCTSSAKVTKMQLEIALNCRQMLSKVIRSHPNAFRSTPDVFQKYSKVYPNEANYQVLILF
jgi:hypothetical protein